jgi:hypothetical protein
MRIKIVILEILLNTAGILFLKIAYSLERQDGVVCTGFVWLRIWTSRGLF